jgi:hypothetical protein
VSDDHFAQAPEDSADIGAPSNLDLDGVPSVVGAAVNDPPKDKGFAKSPWAGHGHVTAVFEHLVDGLNFPVSAVGLCRVVDHAASQGGGDYKTLSF